MSTDTDLVADIHALTPARRAQMATLALRGYHMSLVGAGNETWWVARYEGTILAGHDLPTVIERCSLHAEGRH